MSNVCLCLRSLENSKMLCSPAEIERKRQEALQKLARKNKSPVKTESSALRNNLVSNSIQTQCGSPAKTALPSSPFFKGKPYEKPTTSKVETKPTVNFYGNCRKVVTTVNLISSDKISVTMTAFSQPVIEVLKTVPSRNYDPKTRIWTFHVRDYGEVISKLNNLMGENVIIESLPKFIVNFLKRPQSNEDIDYTRIDTNLLETLLPFQLEGLRFGIQRQGRCYIGDDMGLGKTFEALAVMNYYKNDWPLLIVTTASMKNVWEQTIFKYLPSVSILKVQYMVTGKDFIGDSSILIVSHDLMSRCCDKLLERGFGCIIIDESHNVKNYKTKMTQAAAKLCKSAKRVVLLSGTPALSRPNELYSQLSLIDDKFFGSFFEYAKRYCDLQQTKFGIDSSGKSNLQELEIVLKMKFMIRRRKEDVLGSLPNKTQEIVKLDVNLSGLEKEEKEVLENLSSQFTSTKKAVEKHAILLTFFCETAKIKIPAVCSYVQKVLESKKKFLVFAHHLVMLDAIEEVMKLKGYKYIRIDGSTTSDQRNYFVDKFQTDESCVCAILSITAANAGITLTAANLVIFAELHWNPSILNQAEARVHRIGQENAVVIQYLLADGTADDHMWPLLQEKQNILREMGLTKEKFSDINKTYQNNFIKDGLVETKTESIENHVDDDIMMDDGLDDVLCNIEI